MVLLRVGSGLGLDGVIRRDGWIVGWVAQPTLQWLLGLWYFMWFF